MAVPTKAELFLARAKRHGGALQQKFSAASVAVCGLGGLGSNIAVALARAGVGHLHLLDFDRVDLTNLNRQHYTVRQIGMPKTDALAENLREIAPDCAIRTDTVRITEDNLEALLAGDPIICEALDGAEAKAMLVNGVLSCFPDKYLVAASGMAGTLPANRIRTRRIAERFYLCGDGVSDAGDGLPLLSARVLACAAHQAQTVLRLIAGEYDV